MTCLDANPHDPCEGTVEARSVDGIKWWPRCEHHFEIRLTREEEIRERYPEHQPSDFDPLDAGESWDEP